MLCLTREQRSVSALIEYLDALRDKLISHVDAKIKQVKEQIGLYSCEFNWKIRGLIAQWDEEAANRYMRRVEARERCVEVHEERLKQGIEEIIQARGWEIEEDLPENVNKPIHIMDFVDSDIGKSINIADLAVKTHHIRGEYRLFPKARYCFLSSSHIIVTGEGHLYTTFPTATLFNSMRITVC